ncbi:unnamed protein product [Moneuplotes crassus]|uniref:Uncharacterized protein n=1 Tax=Euplotes crassus TaxID=5936 RepID=A0AAD1U432_EUPCR|nr:unnamed protein product [Moneuplotes crassus]
MADFKKILLDLDPQNMLKLGQRDKRKSGWESRVQNQIKTKKLHMLNHVHLVSMKSSQTPKFHPSDSRLKLRFQGINGDNTNHRKKLNPKNVLSPFKNRKLDKKSTGELDKIPKMKKSKSTSMKYLALNSRFPYNLSPKFQEIEETPKTVFQKHGNMKKDLTNSKNLDYLQKIPQLCGQITKITMPISLKIQEKNYELIQTMDKDSEELFSKHLYEDPKHRKHKSITFQKNSPYIKRKKESPYYYN